MRAALFFLAGTIALSACSREQSAQAKPGPADRPPADREITLAWDPSPDAVSHYVVAVFAPGVPVQDGRELRSTRVSAPATSAKITVPAGGFVVAVKGCNAQACSAWAHLEQSK